MAISIGAARRRDETFVALIERRTGVAALAFDPTDRPTPAAFAAELAPLLDRPPRVVLSRLKPR
jgi:hypothetical protein